MMLTLNDWLTLVGMVAFAGFMSYTTYEVGNAIRSYLHD